MAITSLSEPSSFSEAEVYVNTLLQGNEYNSSNKMGGGTLFHPGQYLRAYSDYAENVIHELTSNPWKGLEFILSQTALYLLNPVSIGGGKIFNPLTPVLPLPYAGGITTTMLDVPMAMMNPVSGKNYKNDDKLMDLYKGEFSQVTIQAAIPPISVDTGYRNHDGSKLEEAYNKNNIYPIPPSGKGAAFHEKDLIDFSKNPLDISDRPYYSDEQNPIDFQRLFDRRTGPGYEGSDKGHWFNLPKNRINVTNKYKRMAKSMNEFDVIFDDHDGDDGFSEEYNKDDLVYMPFWFEDLRNSGKRLYFRAFLTSLKEDFDVDYNVEKFYGRVEPVPIYQNTTRKISVSFKIASFSPAGLSMMWKKINNFIKMLYPTYDSNSVMVAAPIVKMKIGDFFCDQKGLGIPGIIQSPSFDYSNSVWEIEPKSSSKNGLETGKVPMFGEVSFTYLVLHEEQPKLNEDYQFNGRVFRNIGYTEEEIADNVDESDSNENTAIQNATGE